MLAAVQKMHSAGYEHKRLFNEDSLGLRNPENLLTKHFLLKIGKDEQGRDTRQVLISGLREAVKHTNCDPQSCGELELMGKTVPQKSVTSKTAAPKSGQQAKLNTGKR